MVFAQLIEDVLAIVCEFLTDVPDILSFALICSSLHPVAIKRLLSMRPIHLTGRQSIPKFHFFLFTDVCARAPHVRALDLDTRRRRRKSMNQPSDAPRLVEILTSCPRLDRIVVSFDNRSSPGLIHDPRVINTIATIPSLRSLSFYGSTTDAFNFLREVHAPLRTLEIHCRDQPDGYWYPAALENTLKRPRLASTLEDLRLSSFIVDPKTIKMLCNVMTPSTFGMAQYPAVRSLSIRSFKGEPILDDLQHLFPALDGTLSLHRLSESFDENSYARIRAANQRAQENNPSRAWRKLDRLGVHDAPVLYVLGLLCPIRLVVLEYPNAHTKLHYAREALRENPVPKLKLSLLLNRPLPAPDDFLSEELAHALTHLMVCLVYSNNDFSSAIVNPGAFTRVQWDDLLAGLFSVLRPLQSLTHLRVVVHATVYHGANWAIPHSEGLVRAIRASAFDFDGTAAALVRALPSLQFLSLTTSGYLRCREADWKAYERWNVTRAWRVAGRPAPAGIDAGQDGEPVLVGLHDEVAETIMGKEELLLSEADKGRMHLRDD